MSEPSDPKTEAPAEAAVDTDVLFDEREEVPPEPEAEDLVEEAVEVAPAKAPRGGRLLGALALLVALAALGGVAYLYYEINLTDPLTPITVRIDALDAQNRELADSVSALGPAQEDALRQFQARQERQLETLQEGLLESLNQATSQGPPSSREWKVAEVAYLLRIANHRVLMERDAVGALELLKAADGILAELDDFAFYQVRSRLAAEMRSLEVVESNDLSGLFLRLEALKRDLTQLPLKLPEFLDSRRAQADAALEEEGGFWPSLQRQLASSFRMRRFEGSVTPLLSPEEAVYLEINLRLMLERAQLAALKRDQTVFSTSLETAAGWLLEFLDADDSRVQASAADLREVAAVKLDADLPDISGSLTALQAVRGL